MKLKHTAFSACVICKLKKRTGSDIIELTTFKAIF